MYMQKISRVSKPDGKDKELIMEPYEHCIKPLSDNTDVRPEKYNAPPLTRPGPSMADAMHGPKECPPSVWFSKSPPAWGNKVACIGTKGAPRCPGSKVPACIGTNAMCTLHNVYGVVSFLPLAVKPVAATNQRKRLQWLCYSTEYP